MKKTLMFIVCSASLLLAASLPVLGSAVMHSRPAWLYPDAIIFTTIILFALVLFWFLFALITYIESL